MEKNQYKIELNTIATQLKNNQDLLKQQLEDNLVRIGLEAMEKLIDLGESSCCAHSITSTAMNLSYATSQELLRVYENKQIGK